jgi:hypothetical protein
MQHAICLSSNLKAKFVARLDSWKLRGMARSLLSNIEVDAQQLSRVPAVRVD